MNTLIIHPSDPSTTFLDIVYTPIQNKTVITGGIDRDELHSLIESHDRVIMCGHGSPGGLFDCNKFNLGPNDGPYIIDKTTVPYLSKKDNNIFIWCNADRFVEKFALKGFYSGMFISETGEAHYCGLFHTPQDVVDESNFGFCNILAGFINEEQTEMYRGVMKEYGLLAEENPVAFYNYNRLYLS